MVKPVLRYRALHLFRVPPSVAVLRAGSALAAVSLSPPLVAVLRAPVAGWRVPRPLPPSGVVARAFALLHSATRARVARPAPLLCSRCSPRPRVGFPPPYGRVCPAVGAESGKGLCIRPAPYSFIGYRFVLRDPYSLFASGGCLPPSRSPRVFFMVLWLSPLLMPLWLARSLSPSRRALTRPMPPCGLSPTPIKKSPSWGSF